MDLKYYPIAQAGFILLTIVCLALILWGVYSTFVRMGFNRKKAAARTVSIGVAFLAWLTAVSVISISGYLSDFSAMPPRLLPFLLIPLAAVLILTFHPASKRFLAHVPPSWLLYIQAFRVPVEILLWLLFLDNLLPVQMTFKGRNWDVLTGITAPLVAYLCFGGARDRKGLAIAWNIFGLVLLLNIVTTAILSMPLPFRYFMNEPANTIVTIFPIVFLPTVLVPIAYAMHFFSLRNLSIRQKTGAHFTPAIAADVKPKYSV
jgi:hypothetical protein